MLPAHIPPNPSTRITRAMRRPSTQSSALSAIFSGWFNPATVRFALLKPTRPFHLPVKGCFHSHLVTAVACPVNSQPRLSWHPNAEDSLRKSSTLRKLPSILMLPACVFNSCVKVRSAAFSIASATLRRFGAITSRTSPPSATRTGPIVSAPRSRPPFKGPIRTGRVRPGTFTTPPLLESAADSSDTGQPRTIMPPVKYCSAVTPSTTSG